MRNLLVSALILLPAFAMAQLGFERFDGIPVTEESGPLAYPWAGGINHAQFSNMDLNGDGIKDLVVFDKSGDKLITFLMDANGQLTLAPNYRKMFTNQHNTRGRLHDWMLLIDYNCDGKEDIFTINNGGFAVYRNDGDSDTLIFTLMTDELRSDYQPNTPGSGYLNIYVSPSDLPTLMDVDGDSDLDVVTFSLTGYSAEYHRNMSMELYGHCDSLTYILDNACWGNFSEDVSSVSVDLGITCDPPGAPTPGDHHETRNGARHSGFALLGLDIEGDGDKDLLVSNVSFNNMNLLINGESPDSANITTQDPAFPENHGGSNPINISAFPAAFLADVNNDGLKDLICTGYQEGNADNYRGTWLYTNTGTASAPMFSYAKRNFLQDGMIELGTAAYPVFFDYDNDGLKDLFIGNFGYFISTGEYSAQLAYYRNTGSAQEPAFTLQDRDLLSLSTMDLKCVAPTFGDIDGDGDEDLIIGDQVGQVHLFNNTAGAGNPCNFVLTNVGYQGINVSGQFATPQLFDVDNDGLLDLVIGEMTGNLNYFRNEGSATVPQFVLTDAEFGSVNMRVPSLSFGFSAPFLFRNGGETVLVVGSESGRLAVFDGMEDVLSGPAVIEGTIGNGTAVSANNTETPFHFAGSGTKSGRHQYLILASELQAQGFIAGSFHKLAIDILNGDAIAVNQIYLKMRQTSLTDLGSFQTGLTQVSETSTITIAGGAMEFDIPSNFAWDGESNIIVELCWYSDASHTGPDLHVNYTTTSHTSHAHAATATFGGCSIPMDGTNNKRPNMTFTLKPSFHLIGDFPVFEGERTVPFGADVNDDGRLDLAIGNLAGGLAFYRGSDDGFNIGIDEEEAALGTSIGLFPNPNNGSFTVVADPPLVGNVALRVSDLQGRVLWESRLNGLGSTAVATDGLPSGMYLLETSSADGRMVQRFIVNR